MELGRALASAAAIMSNSGRAYITRALHAGECMRAGVDSETTETREWRVEKGVW
jgi:hypothetical protein